MSNKFIELCRSPPFSYDDDYYYHKPGYGKYYKTAATKHFPKFKTYATKHKPIYKTFATGKKPYYYYDDDYYYYAPTPGRKGNKGGRKGQKGGRKGGF